MKILELNIVEFGGLKNKKITLDPKFNIVYGDNESGKSTLVLFIKFMLYGFGRKSSKTSDRERSLSFDGHRACGTMTVECGGERYLIERRTSMGAKLTESVKMTDLGTGENISTEPGALFWGVPSEIFESSAYISQSRAADMKNAQSAIENMLVSADESIDVAKILARIDHVRKEYKLIRGDGGRLYDTEAEISRLKLRQQEVTAKYLEIADQEAALVRTERQLELAQESHKASKQRLDDIMNANIIRRFDELARMRAQAKAGEATLAALETEMRVDGFMPDREHTSELRAAYKAFTDALKKQEKRSEELEDLPTASREQAELSEVGKLVETGGGADALYSELCIPHNKARKLRTAAVFGFVAAGICLAFAAIFALIPITLGAVAASAAGAVGIIAGVLLCVRAAAAKKYRDELCAQFGVPFENIKEYLDGAVAALIRLRAYDVNAATAQALLADARVDAERRESALRELIKKTTHASVQDIHTLYSAEIERIEQLCDRWERQCREMYTLKKLIAGMESELSGYDEAVLRASVRTDISAITPEMTAQAKQKENFDAQRRDMLAEKLRKIRENLAALRGGHYESPVGIADKICMLEQRLDADREYYDALMLAKERIEAASAGMSKNVTPEISRRAGEMMAIVSDCAHNSLHTTKTLDLSVEQDGFLVSSELLSGGTRDAAYICLRIALMMRVFQKEMPPIVMDEALCQLDDTRAKRLLLLLSRLSDTFQCMVFTCQSRERELCRAMGVNALEIQM